MKVRPRINRWTISRRNLIFDSSIKSSLVQPHFVVKGENINQEIKTMPGIRRQSVDVLIKTISSDMDLGIKSHMLFAVIDSHDKDANATIASMDDMHLQEAVRKLKDEFGDKIVILTDVCLCTATNHGHCGIIDHNHRIDNDLTIEELCKIAISHAKAGADYVSASDMMDGRIKSIRNALEENGYTSTGIMSYSVKYASSFYGPFRDAADSSPDFGDRNSHQMDFRSGYEEAIMESLEDQKEGADILMIKPAIAYLDVVRKVKDRVHRPVAIYNVSGEYSMLMNSFNEDSRGNAIVEILNSFQRAGADIIVSYHSREVFAKNLLG